MAEIKFNLLDIDLTSGNIKVDDVTADVKKYLGGRGLANKYLWEIPQGADPLGPDNVLHLGIGPLTGLIGCKTVVSFKSPLTGWAGRSTCSGYGGEEMVRAHYNAGILLRGKASKPVYIYVYNDKVEIRDAADLWGKWRQETEATLRARLEEETKTSYAPGQVFAVYSIGPAGENMVRFANIITHGLHSASKWGCGAVLGSKNVKAVAVKGTLQPDYADHAAVWELFKKYTQHPVTAAQQFNWSRYGASGTPPQLYQVGGEGIKNNHLGWDPVCDKANALEHRLRYNVWVDGCPGCACACFVPFFKKTDYGVFTGEMRHDNTGNYTANIMVGYEEMAELNHLLEELTIDGEESGGLVAWAMDMYENGIITKDDLGGLDLTWGNKEAVAQLMQDIAYRRTKVGNALADGYRRAYKIFGDKSIPLAWETHGCSANTYDYRAEGLGPRIDPLGWSTSHTGARMGTGLGSQLTETATMCIFATPPLNVEIGSNEDIAVKYLPPVTGWTVTKDDILAIERRNYYFNRAFSVREGYDPLVETTLMPRAFTETITNKYGKQLVVDKAAYEARLPKYFTETLKLTEKGLLPRAGLQEMGLDFIIPVLDPMHQIG